MNREQQIENEIKSLQDERELIRSRKTLMCSCNKRSQISKWIVVRDHHYVKPYGCTGGDYWSFSDEYHVQCPKCGDLGRVYQPLFARREKEGDSYSLPISQQDRDQAELYAFINEHIKYFGEVLDAYGNNYTIDSLRNEKKEKEQREWIY